MPGYTNGNEFFYWFALKRIVIHASVKEIILHHAFYEAEDLSAMTVREGNTTYDSRNECIAIIKTSTNTLLYGCKNTIIPDTVVKFGYKAFNFRTPHTISIPESVISIGQSTFNGCSLHEITLRSSITEIDEYAFCGIPQL